MRIRLYIVEFVQCVQLPTVLYIANKIYRKFSYSYSKRFFCDFRSWSKKFLNLCESGIERRINSSGRLQRPPKKRVWAIFERGSFERQRLNQQWNIIEKVRRKYMYYWTNLMKVYSQLSSISLEVKCVFESHLETVLPKRNLIWLSAL